MKHNVHEVKSIFPPGPVNRAEPGGPLRITAAIRLINRSEDNLSSAPIGSEQNLMRLQVFIPLGL